MKLLQKLSTPIIIGALLGTSLQAIAAQNPLHEQIIDQSDYSGVFNMSTCTTSYIETSDRSIVPEEASIQADFSFGRLSARTALASNRIRTTAKIQQSFDDARSVLVEEIFGPSITDVGLSRVLKNHYCKAEFYPRGIPAISVQYLKFGGFASVPAQNDQVI